MARRTYILNEDFTDCVHANGARTIGDIDTLSNNQSKYPKAYQYITDILQPPGGYDSYFQALTVISAAALEGVWQGHGGGFSPGVSCTSRNKIILPPGRFSVNHAIPCSFGGVIGQGTNVSPDGPANGGNGNGNDTTHLRYDHARWIEPGSERGIIKSVNWASGGYLESAIIDGVRVDGRASGWRDASYTQHGIMVRGMGETTNIATKQGVYVHDCNNHGLYIFGAGPGRIGDLSSFDNNQAALYVKSVNSLGNLIIDRLSCDNNGYALYHDLAGGFEIGALKCETGLSNSRGKPFKGQVPMFIKGWVSGKVGLLTMANDPMIDAVVHFNNTANGGRLEIGTLVGWNFANVAIDHRNNRRFSISANYQAVRVVMRMQGTQSKVFIEPPGSVEITMTDIAPSQFNSSGDRLGPVSNANQYAYTASPTATPPWDDTNGGAPPPASVATTVTVSVAPTSVTNGQTSQATAIVYDQFSQVMTGAAVTWSIVSGPGTVNSSGLVTTSGTGSVVVRATSGIVTGDATITVGAAPPPPPPPPTSEIDIADVLVVVNANDPTSGAAAQAYMTAWGISSNNLLSVSLGSADELTSASQLASARQLINARAKQYTVLAFRAPSRYAGGQSITSAITFGPRSVGALTPSPLFGYTGVKPRTDKGVAPSFLLIKGSYTRRSAHGTRPSGQALMLLAKDSQSQGNPRGSARASQTASGLTVWDNRSLSSVGSGVNTCNFLSNLCFRPERRPGTTPIVAGYQSMFALGDPGDAVWAPGFYGDHVTSFGGILPEGAPPSYINGNGQTSLVWHLEKGACMSVGSVNEPWQGSGGNLSRQFVRVDLFHPLFIGGKPVGVAAWASVECPDRMLFAGDGLCATFR